MLETNRAPALAQALAAAALVMIAPGAAAQQLGDLRRGQTYARATCADCHAILAAGDDSRRPGAPPFRNIARQPGINERALSVFLSTPHATMPNLVVTGQDRDDLIAYILSLRPPAK